MNYTTQLQSNISECVYTPYIIKSSGNNSVTYIDLVNFGTVSGFGYLSGKQNFNSWQGFIDSLHAHLQDLYSRCSGEIIPDTIPVTGVTITMSPNTTIINIGETIQLSADIMPSNATNKSVTWSSNNTSVATVNSSGLLTGISAGTATITVTTVDGNKSNSVTFTVQQHSQSYYWYIGVDNPSSITNIQTSNTVAGWHEIGSSLSGFVLDTNNNSVTISETRVPYYIVIPNELNIYDSLGDRMDYAFDGSNDGIICNISGYKIYKWSKEKFGSRYDGVRKVGGVVIKQ